MRHPMRGFWVRWALLLVVVVVITPRSAIAQTDDGRRRNYIHGETGAALSMVVPTGWEMLTVADSPSFFLNASDDAYQIEIIPDPMPALRRTYGANTSIAYILDLNDTVFGNDPNIITTLDYARVRDINGASVQQRLVSDTDYVSQRAAADGRVVSYYLGVGFVRAQNGQLFFFNAAAEGLPSFASFLGFHERALRSLSRARYTPPAEPTLDTDVSRLPDDVRVNSTPLDTVFLSRTGQAMLTYPAAWGLTVIADAVGELQVELSDASGFDVRLEFIGAQALTRFNYEPEAELGPFFATLLPLLLQDTYFGPDFDILTQTNIEAFMLNTAAYAEVRVFYTYAGRPFIDALGLLRVRGGVLLVTSTLADSDTAEAFEAQQGIVRGILNSGTFRFN